ncbi:uncharacterized protein BJX67DRAFT_173130 [Aspergillus lucknowensis]|uniref:GIY-YIG domain-containing protein n=1 Tax=Aspergillus lucknowensis TaxID=176173 RepID=A0ABR4LQQ9_9EURO
MQKDKDVSGGSTLRNAFAEGATGLPIILESLGPIDRTMILQNLISEVRIRYGKRYKSLFDLEDVMTILEDKLNPTVRNLCETGDFTLARLRAIGKTPEDSKRSGVYLHILWRPGKEERFWLYVGQATNVSDRLRTHNDPYRRRRNPSLHYHVWDSATDMESVFVTLAESDAPVCLRSQLLLNMQEMWMSLIFQTLTPLQLDKFLPESVKRLWSGNNLNVALPLWQGFTGGEEQAVMEDACGGRLSFQQYLRSDDPTTRQWAEDARDSFNDIRNSPDPILRKYYQHLHLQRRLNAQKTWEHKQLQNIRQYLSTWVTTKVRKSHSGAIDEVACGKFRFAISKSLGLELSGGDDVSVRLHLTDTRHPNCYARKAEPRDPASRLAVSLRVCDARGLFRVWLKTEGTRNVNKMNSLVDILEVFSPEESRMFERRWHVKAMRPCDKSSRRNVYT